ncbi:hypothetical protein AMTRI_Chr10g228390 [Amborella trichopoda]
MAPRKNNAIFAGKAKALEQVDDGREEEDSPFFPRVRHFPESLPSHISQGLRSGEVPRRWLELMALLASISMMGILNMAYFHVNFPLLKALAERFNHQTNTFFLPTGETTPTLEEVAKISGLAGIAYQPPTTTDDHSIMSARLLGAAYSSSGCTIVPPALVDIYQCLHDQVMRGDRFIEGSNLLEKAQLDPRDSMLGDTASGTHTSWATLPVWAYEHIAIIRPSHSTMVVFAALGLAYVNDSTRPQNVNYYRRVLDELLSFDWVISGLENVSLFFPAMGHSCVILVGKFFTEGYFPQRVLRQFRHIQNYTSFGEAINRCPIFPLRRHSSALLIKASFEGLAKQDKPTTTSNYDSWWEHAGPLPLCSRSSRLRGDSSALGQDLVPHREDGASYSNKQIKSNEDTSDISLEEAKVELARWVAFLVELKEKDFDLKLKTE